MLSGIEDTIHALLSAVWLHAAVAFLLIQSGRNERALAATLTTVPLEEMP
jgi:hypothetical protein